MLNKTIQILAYGFGYFSFGDFFKSYFDKKFYVFTGCRDPGVDIITKDLSIGNIQFFLSIFPVYNIRHLSISKAIVERMISYSKKYIGILFYTDITTLSSIDFTINAISSYINEGITSSKDYVFLLLLDYPDSDFKFKLKDRILRERLEMLIKMFQELDLPTEKICWKKMTHICEVCDDFFLACYNRDIT